MLLSIYQTELVRVSNVFYILCTSTIPAKLLTLRILKCTSSRSNNQNRDKKHTLAENISREANLGDKMAWKQRVQQLQQKRQ